MSDLEVVIWFDSQIAIGSAVGALAGWEVGKKLNYMRIGEKSRFAPKDLMVSHKKWSDPQ
jgi:hypothetical protein